MVAGRFHARERTHVPLLTQNSELRRLRIHNWTIPAWAIRLSDGSTFNACPAAGACAKLCYARNGTYNFPNVKAAHLRHLEHYLGDPGGWAREMHDELQARRFRDRPDEPHLPDLDRSHLTETVAGILDRGGPLIRIHDAGDFFSDDYLQAWLTIARDNPRHLFYSYTKEIERFKRLVEPDPPANFLACYSYGGKQDALIDPDIDQHTDVFPTEDALNAAGYFDQEDHDLLCVVAPTNRVGIVANNIPQFRKLQGGATFSELELAKTARRHPRKAPQ